MLFKIFLLLSILLLVYLVIFRARAVLFQRVFSLLLGAILCLFVLMPDLSTRTAHYFGIGRGVDFIFYLSHVIEMYLLLLLYIRFQKTQFDLTSLIRQLAIQNAESPPDH